MAFEDYDLKSIRDRLGEEFGIDMTITDNQTTTDKRINDALAWISNRRKNWQWLERKERIDVGELSTAITEARYGSGIFSKMQRQVTNLTSLLTAISAREMVDFDGNGQDGIMVTDVTGATLTLDRAYTGTSWKVSITAVTTANPTVITVSLTDEEGGTVTLPQNVTTFTAIIADCAGTGTQPNGTLVATRTGNNTFTVPVDTSASTVSTLGTAVIAREFRVAQQYFRLPIDFIKSEACHMDADTDWNKVNYRDTVKYERIVRDDRVLTTINRVYTILPDPLGVEDQKYIAVYPFFTDRNILHVKYYGDVRKLVADGDVPDLPRSDRFALWYAAAWFVAQWQKDTDMVAYYRDGALNELERMTVEYQFADDRTEDLSVDDVGLDIPQAPGFPRFDA